MPTRSFVASIVFADDTTVSSLVVVFDEKPRKRETLIPTHTYIRMQKTRFTILRCRISFDLQGGKEEHLVERVKMDSGTYQILREHRTILEDDVLYVLRDEFYYRTCASASR